MHGILVPLRYAVTGLLRVVLWSIKEKTNEHPASCQLHLATVAYDLKARVAHLEALHPLGQSKLPPHAVGPLVYAHAFSMLLCMHASQICLHFSLC